MALPIKYRGEDVKIKSLKIKGSDDSYIDIDDLTELYVYILVNNVEAPVLQYSKAGTGDFTALTRVDAETYSFIITNEDTETMTIGTVKMEIKPQFPDTSLPDDIDDRIGKALLFELKDSSIKDA